MKGLLLRDLYGTKQIWKTFLWLFLFCLGYAVLLKQNSFPLMMTAIMSASITMNTINLDEKGGWAYLLCLPVSRKQIVLEKYLYILALEMVLILCGALISAGVTVRYGLSWEEMFLMLVFAVGYQLYNAAVLIPLNFKFGVEKVRILQFALLMLPYLVIVIAFLGIGGGKLPATFDETAAIRIGAVVVAVLAVCCVASCFISVSIFQKKEIP